MNEKKRMKKYNYKQRNFPERDDGPLFVLGEVSCLHGTTLGIVGPRSPLLYTKQVTKIALKTLKLYSCTVISGGAQGIDTIAHEDSLRYGLPNVLVAGGGLRRLMRSTKRGLVERIIANGGLVISQFPLDQSPARWTFPQRNKLIALMSDFLFCPGAGIKSGSMLTVRHMLKLGKPVRTVPSPLREQSTAGTNLLLVSGKIHGTTCFQSMFNNYMLRTSSQIVLTKRESTIVYFIGQGQHTISQLEGCMKEGKSSLLIDLLGLETRNVICQQYVGYYVIIDSEHVTNNG